MASIHPRCYLYSNEQHLHHESLMSRDTEKLTLAESLTHLLEECRMVLPGVQALFGFQLIAVFNRSFFLHLTYAEQCLHLFALALVAIAAGLIMTPAALHRQCGSMDASERFLRVGGNLLLAAMVPLMFGIGLDFFLIAHMVLDEAEVAAILSVLLVGFLAGAGSYFHASTGADSTSVKIPAFPCSGSPARDQRQPSCAVPLRPARPSRCNESSHLNGQPRLPQSTFIESPAARPLKRLLVIVGLRHTRVHLRRRRRQRPGPWRLPGRNERDECRRRAGTGIRLLESIHRELARRACGAGRRDPRDRRTVGASRPQYACMGQRRVTVFAGARFGATATLILSKNSLTSDIEGSLGGGSGLGDLFIQPVILGWTKGQIDLRAAYGIVAPTGRFEAGRDDNVGSGYWTHALSSGLTYQLSENRSSSVSAFAMYELHEKQETTDIRPGDTLTVDASWMRLSTRRPDRPIQFGAVGYAQWQTTDRRGPEPESRRRG